MKKRMVLLSTGLLFFILFVASSCVSSRQEIYHDPNVRRSTISISRIAIAPNRLPINLNNPEKWRKYNWQIAANYLSKRGYEVVDYNTTVNAFDRSGLRMEDTQASYDKYARLAEELSADVIVIPYYGTFSSSKTFFLASALTWNSVATFQFYFASKNEFVSRLDMTGSSSYIAGLFNIVGFGVMFIDPMAGYITMGVGSVLDLTQTMFRSNDSHWRSAFKSAIRKGLRSFVNTYPVNVGTVTNSASEIITEKLNNGSEFQPQKNPSDYIKSDEISRVGKKIVRKSIDAMGKITKIYSDKIELNLGERNWISTGDSCYIVTKMSSNDEYRVHQRGIIVGINPRSCMAKLQGIDGLSKGWAVLVRRNPGEEQQTKSIKTNLINTNRPATKIPVLQGNDIYLVRKPIDAKCTIIGIRGNEIWLNAGKRQWINVGDSCFVVKKTKSSLVYEKTNSGIVKFVDDNKCSATFKQNKKFTIGELVIIRRNSD